MLRQIREDLGLTTHAAARHLHRSQASISQLETGHRGIRRPALENMLDRNGVTDSELRESLFRLARESRKPGWWQSYEEILSAVDRLVDIRMRRQAILTRDDAPVMTAVVDEAALHRAIGGSTIRAAQLRHLIALSEVPKLSFRVVPFSAGVYAGTQTGPFVIMDLDVNGPSVVEIDSPTGISYLEHPGQVETYAEVFEEFDEAAYSVADTRRLLQALLSDA